MNNSNNQTIRMIHLGGYVMSVSTKLIQKIVLTAVKEVKSEKSIHPDHIDRWKEVIKKHIQIPRVKTPDQANPGQIRRALEEIFWDDEELASVLHEIWIFYNESLISECTEWLNGHNLDEVRPFYLAMKEAKSKVPDHEPTVLGEMARDIQKKRPNLGTEEEIKLGILTAIHIYEEFSKTVKEEKAEEVIMTTLIYGNPPQPDPWEDILSTLRATLPEDARWKTCEAFIGAVQEIAAQKATEAAKGQKLQQLIALLQQNGEEIKTREPFFVEGKKNSSWDAAHVAIEQVESACGAIQSLHERLQEYDRLDQIPTPVPPSERRKLREGQRAAEMHVTEGYQAAQIFFQGSAEPGIELEIPTPEVSGRNAALPVEELTDYQTIITTDSETTANPVIQAASPAPTENSVSEAEEGESQSIAEVEHGASPQPAEELKVKEEPVQLPKIEPAIEPEISVAAPELICEEEGSNAVPARTELVGASIMQESTVFDDQPLAAEPSIENNKIPEALAKVVSETAETILPLQAYDAALIDQIDRRELTRAYWLAWAQEQLDGKSPLSSRLIAAAQGAIWSIALWPEQPSDLNESLCSLVDPESLASDITGLPSAWLRNACGIYFTLVMPNQGWEKWLDGRLALPVAPQLSKLSSLVLEYHDRGLAFDPELVQVILNADATDQILNDHSRQARQWLNQSVTRTTRMHRANLLWQGLLQPGQGELYLLIEPVASNQQAKAREILRQLEKWQDRPALEKKIQRLDQELRLRNEFSIVGEARFHLINWIMEICEIAERWCKTVVHRDDLIHDGDWIYNQTREMCNIVREQLKDVRQEIYQQNVKDSPPDVSAVIRAADWILEGLEAILSKDTRTKLSTWPKPVYPSQIIDRSTHGLALLCLAQPLSYHFELDLDNQGMPVATPAGQVLSILIQNLDRAPADALQGWLDARDYRFIDQLLEKVPDGEIWMERCRESFYADLDWLEHTVLYDTDEEVEQANLDRLITEQEYVEYKNRIESIQKIRRLADWDSNRAVSFGILAQRLESIRAEISPKRQGEIDHLKERWNKIRFQVLRLIGDDQAFNEKIKISVEHSLESHDISLAKDYLDHLENAKNNGKVPSRELFEGKRAGEEDILFNFQDLLPAYVDLFDPVGPKLSLQSIADSIKSDEPLPGIPHVSPSSTRRAEAQRAIEAWMQLKRFGPGYESAQSEHIKTILTYLGFFLGPEPTVTQGKSTATMPNFQHWHVRMSTGDSAPVAAFGSKREGEYEVIGVWQKSNIEAITSQVNALMQQTANKPAILFYFHYFTPARRELLLSAAHREILPMLVIDEPLLLYLARINDTRLKPMFYCTLPFSVIDPYYPFVRGMVPPEAFKGRKDFVQQLMDPSGPVIVYGGRQLGKSALLRQVERAFDKRDENRFAIVVDIKTVGDPASGKINYQRDFCDTVVKELVGTTPKLIEDRRSYDIDRLVSQIQEQVNSKNRRIILLLDEVDKFLDADAEKNFYVIHKLKDLMDRTNLRFKIVLAGLHNVQRFQRMSNQPLGHFGKIEIGPLEPEPARDLLVQPLHALGYRFGTDPHKEDTSIALHICSLTNFHPGLIQLFGKHLIEHLRNKYKDPARPPLMITRTDVETVYRTKEVREGLQDRFNLTLNCDPRYAAITLALILEQWDERNGFDRHFTSRNLYKIAQEWWPRAFDEAEMSMERFNGFLDEMCSLGILSAGLDGSFYRLRSPNLIHLIGTQEQLFTRMDAISKAPPPGKQALDNYHARMEEGAEFSPLDFAQERLLNAPHSGVAIIYGSNALCVNSLAPALQRLLPSTSTGFREIHIAARGSEALQLQLKQFVRENQDGSFLIALRELDGEPDRMLEEVQGATLYCRQVSKRVLRVCFILNPQTAWQWHQIPASRRDPIEDQLLQNMSLARWDRLGIRQRMELEIWGGEEIPGGEKLVAKIVDVTGGWTYLLDEYLGRCKKKDAEQALDEFRQEIASPDSPIRKEFTDQLGIYEYLPGLVMRSFKDETIRQKLKEGNAPIDILAQEIKKFTPEEIGEGIEYLKRLGVLVTEPFLSLEPVISRII